jgi:hypothetical protein
MEVLIAVFILSLGLLGVAAIIPLGQLALWETAKADRSGACGRAGMREIQVRRMLDFRYWFWLNGQWGVIPINTPIPDTFATVAGPANFDALPVVVDPLGYLNYADYFGANPDVARFGRNPLTGLYLPRRTLRLAPLSPLGAPLVNTSDVDYQNFIKQIFFWNDDLPFSAPTSAAQRPALVPYTYTDPVSGRVITGIAGESSYSWFFTALPAGTEVSLPVAARRLFSVSVVVCYKRNFQPQALGTLEGEHAVNIAANTGFPGQGIGGGTIQLDPDSKVNVKEGQWVMLYHVQAAASLNRCNWYRVVGVGQSTDASGKPLQVINLSGPDWDATLQATLVVVPGVIGVYTTTMELDWDPLWTK